MRRLKFVLWCSWRHNWRPNRNGYARSFCDACEGLPPTVVMLNEMAVEAADEN